MLCALFWNCISSLANKLYDVTLLSDGIEYNNFGVDPPSFRTKKFIFFTFVLRLYVEYSKLFRYFLITWLIITYIFSQRIIYLSNYFSFSFNLFYLVFLSIYYSTVYIYFLFVFFLPFFSVCWNKYKCFGFIEFIITDL